MKPQVWQTFSANGAVARASDLSVVEEVVLAIHEGAAQVRGSLKSARASVMQLDFGIDTTHLYEVCIPRAADHLAESTFLLAHPTLLYVAECRPHFYPAGLLHAPAHQRDGGLEQGLPGSSRQVSGVK